MVARASSERFVGRVEELGLLNTALGDAAQGLTTTVLLGGEAGVGKSRLVELFASRARERGARVLAGACLQLGEEGLPFGAVTEALRSLAAAAGLPMLRRLAGEDAGELQRLVPDLRPAGQRDIWPDRRPLDTSSQLRLFEALLRLVHRAAADTPLVLVLEDLHWADASTRDLLVFLAHNLRSASVVVVATFRSDELHRGHPLRPALAHIARGERVERLDLKRFERVELQLLLEEILGQAPGAELLDRVFDRSQGNAFFAEELLAVGGEQLAGLPVALSDILLEAIDRLPRDVTDLLRLVAAAGGHVRHELLVQVAPVSGVGLDAALRTAVEQLVLLTDPAAGTYSFRHALLTEAVYSTLLPGEVARLHGSLAAAIDADPRLAIRAARAELAHHWEAARDQPRSLVASLEAAREAEAAAGVLEARRHVERALQLWSQVEDADKRTGLEHTSVMQWAAKLSYLAGEPQGAVALQQRVVAESVTDPARQAIRYDRLGWFLYSAGDTEAAQEAFATAVRLMPSNPPSAERARVLASYSQILMLCFQQEQADTYAHEALAMARTVGARAVEGHALTTLGINLATRDAGGLDLLRQARAIAEELGADDDVARLFLSESGALVTLGRFDDAITVASEGLEYARTRGKERSLAAALSGNLAEAALYVGRWQLADDVLRVAPRHSGGIGAAWAHLLRAHLFVGRGQLEAALAELTAAETTHAHTHEQTRNMFLKTQLGSALLAEDADHAIELITVRPSVDDPVEDHALELRALSLRALADLGADVGPGRELADQIVDECHQLAARATPTNRLAPVWEALAEAEHARAIRDSDLVERWRTASTRCGDLGLAHDGAYALYRQAQARLDHGLRSNVETLLRTAHETANQLKARPLLEQILDLAQRARIDLGIDPTSSPHEELGLTVREIEVLSLVAEGRTNPQIAEQLYISRKTASVHISNILRKLGVSNRGEAAAIAHRLGLSARQPR